MRIRSVIMMFSAMSLRDPPRTEPSGSAAAALVPLIGEVRTWAPCTARKSSGLKLISERPVAGVDHGPVARLQPLRRRREDLRRPTGQRSLAAACRGSAGRSRHARCRAIADSTPRRWISRAPGAYRSSPPQVRAPEPSTSKGQSSSRPDPATGLGDQRAATPSARLDLGLPTPQSRASRRSSRPPPASAGDDRRSRSRLVPAAYPRQASQPPPSTPSAASSS